MNSALGSDYDRWLTTPPDESWYNDVPPLQCGTCDRFISRAKDLVRTEPWEDGWDCNGKEIQVQVVYCSDIYDDARNCWQEGMTKEEVAKHDATYHKNLSDTYTPCGEASTHKPHRMIEVAGVVYVYCCKAGHETQVPDL